MYISAQAANTPGQIASASELSALAFPAYIASSSSTSAVSSSVDIANVENRHDRTVTGVWLGSICAMLGASGMDAGTSCRKYEKNSLLASSDGRFGAKGLSIKAGFAGAVILPQLLLRKRKDLRTKFAIGNFAEAAVFSGDSIHNMNIPAPKN